MTSSGTAIYFQTLAGCKDLLEEELRLSFPMWQKIQDYESLVIYETSREYLLEEISDLTVSFALGKGHFLGASNAHALEETIERAQEQWQTTHVHRWDFKGDEHQMGDRKARAVVIDTFKMNDDHYLIAARFQVRGDFAPFAGPSPIPTNGRAPSYDYQCMAEAFKRFRPLVSHDEVFLDVAGSERAGRTYYLLEKGFRVIGVDEGQSAPGFGQEFKADYLHVDQDVMGMKAKDFQGLPPADWVVASVAAGEQEVVTHLMTILKENEEARGLMLTVTVRELEDVAKLRHLVRLCKESAFSSVKTGLVPSHQKECFMMASKPIGTVISPRSENP